MIELGDALSKELSLLPERSRVMVIGEPDTGKSTLVAVLARWFRSVSRKVAVVDSDIGQSDVGPPGFVSYGTMEQDVRALQSVTRNGSYMVGNTSPHQRELPVLAGTQACVKAAQSQGADVILIDTCGLVKPQRGLQLKCAKAAVIKPDLIIALSTPGIAPLNNCLRLLGYGVRNVLPLRGARIKSIDERRNNRASRWNTYIGKSSRLLNVNLYRAEVRRWWGEGRYVDINQVPHGTVAAVHDSRRPGFQVPCIWTAQEGVPSILAPLPEDYQPDTVWVSSYKLGLDGTTVISA